MGEIRLSDYNNSNFTYKNKKISNINLRNSKLKENLNFIFSKIAKSFVCKVILNTSLIDQPV